MTGISVEIVRNVGEHFLGFVEVQITDAIRDLRKFIETMPVVSNLSLADNDKL
ncbi:hypothetical protein [Sapientia aquatica]|uniref:hypothetical protein n=1 Tax=Sapientia aquatica TaxID=1549640 RepID=UPI001404F866|nr:hypothetical protein [Sapientia aquatica]